ncbi:MAG: PAS domain S-box protein [Candidatus Hydrogenedentes bacterium]|nr:PAS domain S-box protein [Candidatus Hydrogenedentota bacterium]
MFLRIKRLFSLWIEEREPASYDLSEELKVIVSLEGLSLFARYILIFVMIALLITGLHTKSSVVLLPFLCIIILHNLITHLIFYFNRPVLFGSLLSYILHLASITSSIVVTGEEYSPLFVGYILFQHIHIVYPRTKPHPIITTLVILVLYNFSIIGSWSLSGMEQASFLLLTQNVILIFSGVISLVLSTYYQGMKERLLQLEQELVYSQNITKSIIESIRTPIIIFDENEIITEINSHLVTYLQETESSLIGKRVRSIFFDDLMIGEHLSLLKSTGEINTDAIIITTNGTEIPVQFIVRSFYKNHNRLYLALIIDKREQKKLQEIANWVKKQKEELDEKMSRIKELQLGFSESILPKMFTNLTTLRNSIKMLLDETWGSVNEKQRTLLESAKRALSSLEEDLQKEIYTQDVQMPSYDT